MMDVLRYAVSFLLGVVIVGAMKRLIGYWQTRKQRQAEREGRDSRNRDLYARWADKIRTDPESAEYKAWSDYWGGNPPPLDTPPPPQRSERGVVP